MDIVNKVKEEMKYVIAQYGLDSKEAYNMCIRLSIEKDKMFRKNTIQSYYNRSFEKLIEYLKENDINPNKSKWNKYAIENNCLSAETIGYIYGKGFNKLCREIRKGITRYNKVKNTIK